MRRIALIAVLLGAVVAWVTSLAGASDSHTYHVEMYNAFGIVNGSNVRIAGVEVGRQTLRNAIVIADEADPPLPLVSHRVSAIGVERYDRS